MQCFPGTRFAYILVRCIIALYISSLKKKLKNLIYTEVFFLLHHYSLCSSGVRKSRQEFRTCKFRAKLWGGEELFAIGWPEIGLGGRHRHRWQAPAAEVAGMHRSFLHRTPCSFALEGVLFFVPFLDQEELNRRDIIPPELYGSRVVKTTVKLLDFPSDIGFL